MKNGSEIVMKINTYKEIQCISFTLKTGLSQNNYRGLKDDNADIAGKLELLNDVLTTSYNSPEVNKSSKCLKVFMLPEFYFRGATGAYNMDSVPHLTESLRNLVNSPKYKDWLFVFGTTVAFSDGERARPNVRNAEIYNYSLIQKGNSGEDKSFVVMKEVLSTIDFIDTLYPTYETNPDVLSVYNTHPMSPIKNPNPQHMGRRDEDKQYNYDSNGIFEVDGLRVGVEICLDHVNYRLNRSSFSKEKPLDLHLVVSSGVRESYHSSRKLARNGISFLCDGSEYGYTKVVDSKFNNIDPLSEAEFKPSNKEAFYKQFPLTAPKLTIFKPHSREKERLKNIFHI